MKEEIKRLLQSIIYILMGLQILLGLAWIFCNLGEVPRFEESTELLAMSKTFVIDEYTGILYPVCLRLVTTLEAWIKLPGCAFMYVVQLVAAYLAYGYFMRRVVFYKQEMILSLRIKICFYSCFVITIPTVVQVHMALLPYSLASSVFIVLLADTVLLWRREWQADGKMLLRIGAWWVISAQLSPSYAWISGIAVGISLVRYFVLHKQGIGRMAAVCLVAILCISGLNAAFQTEGSMGKIQKTVGSLMVSRFVWPNFLSYKYFWKPEVTEIWDYAGLAELSTYPEKVIYEFGPMLEESIGKEAANKIYWEMSVDAIQLGTKDIVLTLLKDGAAYVCPPLTVFVQLQGIGVSYTGWNYSRMQDYAPQLTKYYVDYALGAWVCMLGLGMIQVLLSLRKMQNVEDKETAPKEWVGMYLCIISLFTNIWYVMSNGHMQDYKLLIVNSVLWAFLMVKIVEKTETKEAK